MPGIAGIISKRPRLENRQAIEAMVASMKHESFYSSGTHVDEKAGVWLGWTTFAGSYADCLPIWNEQRNLLMIFAGEVFPDREEVDSVRGRGHEFKAGNASYLLHLYEELGPDFVSELNGWFAGLVLDLRLNKIFLFNDRFGAERIYFHEEDDGLFFASEAKALLKVLPETRRLELNSFAETLTCNCALQNRTLFSGVSLLPGASLWTFSIGQPPQKTLYFKKEAWEQQPVLDESQYYEKFKCLWQRLLPRYVRSGERAALSLTGGVDSRMILAWLKTDPGSLPCYTWGSRYRECNDVRLARKIAQICHQPHQPIPLDGTFLSEFPRLAEEAIFISDGTADATGAMDLHLQRIAREIAPIRVTGSNGGELLRRKVVFKAGLPSSSLFTPELLRFAESAAETYRTESLGNRGTFSAFKQLPWFMYRTLSLERSQLTLRTPYIDNDLVALSYQAPPECLNLSFALRVTCDGEPALARIPTDRGIVLRGFPGTKKLRHLWHQSIFKAEYAFDTGMPQWLARVEHRLAPLRLGTLLAGHHKSYHFRMWCRDELASYIKDVLLDQRTLTRPYLNSREVVKVVEAHVQGTANYTDEILRLLTAELVQRTLLEQN